MTPDSCPDQAGGGFRHPQAQAGDKMPKTWLRGDLVAGLTVWAVLVPEALAYATIAGVSPAVGL